MEDKIQIPGSGSASPGSGSRGSRGLLDVYDQVPVEPVRGEGAWLFDGAGKRWLDLWGGHAVAVLGYGHPRMVEAVTRQAKTLLFQSNAVPLSVRERAAERLLAFGPPNLARVFFVNSGAEAIENALRLAFRATGRKVVVALEGAFHGRSAASGAATAGSAPAGGPTWFAFPAAPFEVRRVPIDDEGALRAAVDRDVAAVIAEPVQGVAGARALSRAFLHAARAACSAHGALLVLDEVQTGMGRTGAPFAAQHYGVAPDVLAVAKGLAGGVPAGAVLMTEDVAKSVGRGDLGSTFGGGPLACALIETVIDVIERERLLDNVRRLGPMIAHDAVAVAGGPFESADGLGFLIGLRARGPAKDVVAALRRRGILAGGASDRSVVRLLPPLVLDDAQVGLFLGAVREIAQEGKPA